MSDESLKLLYEIHSKVNVLEERSGNILSQVQKTNGRVTKSENDIDTLRAEQNRFKTIVATVGSLVGLVWTGVTFLFK